MKVLAGVSAFVLCGLIAYFGWMVARQWNYHWGYEQMVKDTVCEMVKPEHLKDKSDCKPENP